MNRRGFLGALAAATMAVALVLPRFGHHEEGEVLAEFEEDRVLRVVHVDEVTKTVTVEAMDGKPLGLWPGGPQAHGYEWIEWIEVPNPFGSLRLRR